MPQAILPEDIEESTISSMSTGETCYTVSWAMWCDQERRLWLHPDYTTQHFTGGTVQMRVEKRSDGYHVWPPSDARYHCGEPGYVSPSSTQWIPVAKLHR